jgi:hypothetical protein
MVDKFARAPALRSEVIQCVADALRSPVIPIGIIVADIRILGEGPLPVPAQEQRIPRRTD